MGYCSTFRSAQQCQRQSLQFPREMVGGVLCCAGPLAVRQAGGCADTVAHCCWLSEALKGRGGLRRKSSFCACV